MLQNLLNMLYHKIRKTRLIRFYALYLCQTSTIEICSREFSCAHHGEADIKRQCDNTKSDTMG
jgi:hypothetical protein